MTSRSEYRCKQAVSDTFNMAYVPVANELVRATSHNGSDLIVSTAAATAAVMAFMQSVTLRGGAVHCHRVK